MCFAISRKVKALPILTLCVLLLAADLANAARLDMPWDTANAHRPSFADNMVVIDDVGKGGVNYEFMVSATQITVQDWVDFLNAVAKNSSGNGLVSDYGASRSMWMPYAFSGGQWRVRSPFDTGGAVNILSSSDAGNLPIDGLSLNQVAHYMNWLATGDIYSGAFTFSRTGGNSNISAFNASDPRARLPLQSELIKAMYWKKATQTFNSYPTGNAQPSMASVSYSTGRYTGSSSGVLFYNPAGPWWAQVGQGTGNAWGLLDMGGNRHETTLQNNLSQTIVIGASAFTGIDCSLRVGAPGYCPSSLLSNERQPSVGYRVWAGVQVPSGKIAVSKVVSGGTDGTRDFSFTLNCDGNLYDKTFTLKHGQAPFVSSTIPQGTQCTVTETAPTGAPAGYTYGAAQYNPSQTITIGNNTTTTITVTNPLQPVTPTSCTAGNLLKNPSFENGLSDNQSISFPFQDWLGVGFAGNPSGTVAWTFGDAYGTAGNGTNSGASYQDVPIAVGSMHRLTFYAGMHQPAVNDGTVELQYLDVAKNPVGGAAIFPVEYQAMSESPNKMFDGPYELSLPAAPTGAAYVRVKVTHTHRSGTGSGWDATKADNLELACSSPPPPSQGCPAGTVPSPVNMLTNGDLATEPAASDINAFPGRDNTTPGYYYSAAKFYSQAQYRGRDSLPSDAVGGDWGTVNKFTINKGYVIKNIYFSPGDQDQMPFPGDPANNVAKTDWWFYSNGNALGAGDPSGPPSQEYLLWEQDLTNLVVGKTYTFSAYISNVLEISAKGADVPDDPIVRLRVGGTTGLPDGMAVYGPYTMPEAETSNSKPLNGWKRVEYAFTATSSSMKFKFTSAAKGNVGDDFGLTALGVNECIKSVLNVSKTVNGKPLGFTSPDYSLNLACSNGYNQSFTLKDGETKTFTDIPAGTTCSVTEPSTPTPPLGYLYAAPVMSPSTPVTLSANAPSNISVTNTLSWKTGSLKITKQVSGKPASFTSPDFGIAVDCSDNSFDQTVTLKDGANTTISGIPENTTCTVSEPTVPSAPSGYTYLSPDISPGTVSILGNQTLAVTVTNTLEELCMAQEDNILNASSPTYGIDRTLLANNEYVYMPVAQRSETPLWSGNLKKFLRKDGHIYNADGTTEAVDSEGKFTNATKDLWSAGGGADGKDITKGGAANKLPLPDSRSLYTDKNNGTVIEMKAPGVTPAMFGVTGAAERDKLLAFIRGKNADGTPRYHLGDTLNGKPELVSYASGDVVFLATNEGYLHAIDVSTGVEKWGFMPNALLKNVKTQYDNNQTGAHVAGIDGGLTVWRFQYDKNKDGMIDSNETFTYLYFGLREGGSEYYMLDITNVLTAPTVVWHTTNASPGFSEMGQAWSKPALAKMRLPVDNTGAITTSENTTTHKSDLFDVLVFGGGYNSSGLPQGRTVFIVDAMTGDLVWSLRDISGASDGLSPASALGNSIPGDIRVLDIDRNGALDRLYFADTGGNVWRVDMDVDLSDGTPAGSDTFYDYRKARLSKFAALGGSGADNRKFFFEPDVSLMDYQGKTLLLLAIGSGNRANGLDTSVQDRFYVLIDRNPYQSPTGNTLFPITHANALADIDNASAIGSGLLANSGLDGWFYKLPNTGEKVLASATTFLNKVVFTTFTPGSVTTGATCDERAAKARAYVLDLFTGAAVADLDRKGGKERSVIAAENGVLDTAQLVFSNPSTVDNKACSDRGNCTAQFVEVRVGRMSRPLIDTSNSLVPGVADGQDMDIGKLLPRVFWRNDQ
jgi:hypothetical protein